MLRPLTCFMVSSVGRATERGEVCMPGGGSGCPDKALKEAALMPGTQSLRPPWWSPASSPRYLSWLAAHKEVTEELAGWAAWVSSHEGKLAVGRAPGGVEDAPQGMRHQKHLARQQHEAPIRPTGQPHPCSPACRGEETLLPSIPPSLKPSSFTWALGSRSPPPCDARPAGGPENGSDGRHWGDTPGPWRQVTGV